ncbi:MAG TPA: DUF1653 domain-containing protein [Candidatus Paceibacterota bacterium]|nr:DUF1653 domain-containing protein [Candidatus Paceibacterota bacterium]
MIKFGKYRHYKGRRDLWVRPLAMFTEEVEVGGEKIQWFRYIGE